MPELSSSPLTRVNQWLLKPWLKPLIWLLCAMPVVGMWVQMGYGPWSLEQAEQLSRDTGIWALRFLWLALLVTPLREISQWHALLRYRRSFGVAAFVYAVLHVLVFVGITHAGHVADAWAEVQVQPVLMVGMVALLLLLPLGLTSFNAAIRALGGRKWQVLHKLAYVAALLALWHFYSHREVDGAMLAVWLHALVLALALGWRMLKRGGVWAMFQIR